MLDEKSESVIEAPQSNKLSKKEIWQWWLPYLGGIVGLFALIGSLIVFIISTSLQIYKGLVYKEQVTIITFNSETRQVFLNSGDGEVFLSHIEIECEKFGDSGSAFGIFRVVKPREFLFEPIVHPSRIAFATDSNAEWETVLEKVRAGRVHNYEYAGKKYLLIPTYFSKGSSDLKFFEKTENLKTVEASGELVYFSANGGKRLAQKIPLEGLIFLEEESIAKRTSSDVQQ